MGYNYIVIDDNSHEFMEEWSMKLKLFMVAVALMSFINIAIVLASGGE